MRRSGFHARLGPARFFFSTHEAVGFAQNFIEQREIRLDLDAEAALTPRVLRMPAGAAFDV
jgi:hypothetical protein